jgi:hypothetical protein
VAIAVFIAIAVAIWVANRRGAKRAHVEVLGMTNIPQINIGKQPEQHFNIVHMLPLPADTPFGNMALKYTQIVFRLDHANLLIREVFRSYVRAKTADDGTITHHLLLAEELVYWIRKTADELIALVHILNERQSAGAYPDRINPDGIGPFLALKNIPAWAQPHCDFLRLLNEISNAYKHSFINSDAMLVGRDEPGVYALSLKRNDLEKATTLHNIRVTELVVRFDAFFQAALAELKNCKLPHRDPNEKKPAPIYVTG